MLVTLNQESKKPSVVLLDESTPHPLFRVDKVVHRKQAENLDTVTKKETLNTERRGETATTMEATGLSSTREPAIPASSRSTSTCYAHKANEKKKRTKRESRKPNQKEKGKGRAAA